MYMSVWYTDLAIPELRERIHDDTEDDVESYGWYDDEEGDVVHGFVKVECERFSFRDGEKLKVQTIQHRLVANRFSQ